LSDLEVKVVEAGDEVEAQTESTTAMAVGLLEYPEHFESADNVLDGDALTGEALIGCDLLRGEGVLLAFAVGGAAIEMLVLDTLIAPIR